MKFNYQDVKEMQKQELLYRQSLELEEKQYLFDAKQYAKTNNLQSLKELIDKYGITKQTRNSCLLSILYEEYIPEHNKRIDFSEMINFLNNLAL
jgi:hypothetical protein